MIPTLVLPEWETNSGAARILLWYNNTVICRIQNEKANAPSLQVIIGCLDSPGLVLYISQKQIPTG